MENQKKALPIFIAIIISSTFFSCTYDKAPLPVVTFTPPTVVSFSVNIQPIFTANCSVPGCHIGSNPPNSLNLQTGMAYTSLIASGYTSTSNPEGSTLYTQLSTGLMPQSGPKLSSSQLQLVLNWMQQGALNN